MTRRGGFARVWSAGGMGGVVSISIAEPATLSRTIFTLLTAAGGCAEVTIGGAAGVVGSAAGGFTAAAEACGTADCGGTGEAGAGFARGRGARPCGAAMAGGRP